MFKKKIQGSGMIDISSKQVTLRTAKASASISLGRTIFRLFMAQGSPKGNVLETARIAGILAAKTTWQIIPMCHPLRLNKVNIDFQIDKKKDMITVLSDVKCHGRTGVEMEALCAAAAAALTIYDMMKWAGKGMRISCLQLLEKRGGQSGDYKRKDYTDFKRDYTD